MPDLELEKEKWIEGFRAVAGIDEAGRGPLAGPVCAAAVILPEKFELPGLNDSKKLTEKKRECLFEELSTHAEVIWALGWASAQEIDEINILKATHLAMKRAAESLSVKADFCLIDGLPVKNFDISSAGIVKGDSKSLSIAAASIFAKVSRDRQMRELDDRYPGYGFAKHKGYGTKQHQEALQKLGASPEHRKSFAPVAKCL